MPRLQLDISSTVHAQLKEQAKANNKLFRPYLAELLEKLAQPKATKAITVIDPQVDQVIEHFEKHVAKVRSRPAAIKPVQQMIEEFGFNRVIGAINAVAASKGMDYAPVISSLATLQEKWHNLEHFSRRKMVKINNRVFKPTVQ